VVICIIRGRFFDRVPEERVGWDPRGIVDREEQREYGTPVSQPRVMVAKQLLGHMTPVQNRQGDIFTETEE